MLLTSTLVSGFYNYRAAADFCLPAATYVADSQNPCHQKLGHSSFTGESHKLRATLTSTATSGKASREGLCVLNGVCAPPGRTRSSSCSATRSLEYVISKGKLKRGKRGRGWDSGDSSDEEWLSFDGNDGSGGSSGSMGGGSSGNGWSSGYNGGEAFFNFILYEANWLWQILCLMSVFRAAHFIILGDKKSSQEAGLAACMDGTTAL